MKTLDLVEAANFLKMNKESLRRKVTEGSIPGAKPGKRWVFIEEDLVIYLHMLYTKGAKVSDSVSIGDTKCHYTKVQKGIGGLGSHKTEDEYKNLLGLKTNVKLSNTTTN